MTDDDIIQEEFTLGSNEEKIILRKTEKEKKT